MGIPLVVGFSVLLVLWVVGIAAQGQSGLWADLLAGLSMTDHLHSFARGLIRSADVAYYVSLSAIGIFLTYRTVESGRWR